MDWAHIARAAKDVQYERPGVGLRIPSVGVRGIKLPLDMREGSIRVLGASVDALVDLPPNIRGANLSRSVASVLMAMEGARSLAGLAEEAARLLLEYHEYSELSRVVVRATAFVEEASPATGLRSPSRFVAIADSTRARSGAVSTRLGASVVGITACPCGAELMRAAGCGPCATHMQRARVTLIARPASSTSVEILRSSALGGLSSGVLTLLKRADEAYLISSALSNARFAEDAFRLAALHFARSVPSFPLDGELFIHVRSHESIHGHDVVVSGYLSGELLRSLRTS